MIQVRRAKKDDADIVVSLFEEFMKYHEEVLIKRNPAAAEFLEKKENYIEIFRKFISKKLRARNAVVFIAEEGGVPAGYCLSFIKDYNPIFKIGKVGYLSDLFVRNKFHGKGISTMFKDESFKWFKSKGLKYTTIAVRADNPDAKAIYNHWGFMDDSVSLIRKL